MYNYQKTILNGYVEVANELSRIRNLQQINSLKTQQSDVLKQSVETSNELFKYARASYLEVLLAQQSALQTHLELIDVIKQQRISTVNIYKALGGGWR
jgi:multidrug efflux system outer membrane protein